MVTVCADGHSEPPFYPLSGTIKNVHISVDRVPKIYRGFEYQAVYQLSKLIQRCGLVGYDGTYTDGLRILRKIMEADSRGTVEIEAPGKYLREVRRVKCERYCDGKSIEEPTISKKERFLQSFSLSINPKRIIRKAISVEFSMLDAIQNKYERDGRIEGTGRFATKVLDDEKEIFPEIKLVLIHNYNLDEDAITFKRA